MGESWLDKELSVLKALGAEVATGESRAAIIQGAADSGKSHLAGLFARSLGSAWDVRIHTFRDARSKGPMNELIKLAKDFGAGEPPTNWTYIDEAFLLSKNGLLIFHCGSGGSAVDEDILGSMLTAVQDFVKDSFGDSGKKGGLNELSYRGLKIMIEHGEHAFMACVVSRGEHPAMRGEIQGALRAIESACSDRLADWDGDKDSLPEVPGTMERLLSSRFPRLGLDSEAAVAQQNLRFEWLRMAVSNAPLERPQLLILEDMHSADRTSLQGLAYLVRGVRGRQVFFLMTMQQDDAPQFAKDIVSKLALDGHIHSIELKPMGAEDFSAFLSGLLPGAEVADGASKEIFHAAGGVPGTAAKLVKILTREGRLVSEGGIWALKGRRAPWWSAGAGAAHRSLERLPPRVLDMLELVAVLGRPADAAALASALHQDGAAVAQCMEQAVASGMAERTPDGSLALETAAVEEAVKAGMGPVRTAMWHRRIASVILAAHPDGKGAPVFELAMHLAEGHDTDSGIEWCLKAAELSSAEYAFPEAIRFYGWSVDLMERTGGDPRYVTALRRLGDAQDVDGDFRAEIATHEKLLSFEGLSKKEQAEILLAIGASYKSLGDAAKARELLEKALAELGPTGETLEKARIQNYLATMRSKEAPAEALPVHEAYLHAALAASSTKDVALAHKAIGGVHFYAKRLDGAIGSWKEALAAYDALSDDFGRSDILVNLGGIYNMKGDVASSLPMLAEGIALKEKIGDFRRLASALNNQGIAYVLAGDFERAIESHRRSLEVKVRVGDTAGVANSYNSLGALLYERGDLHMAVENFLKALGIYTRLGDVRSMTNAHNNLADVYCDLGNFGEAARHADFALVMAKQKNFLDIQAEAMASLARAASSKGDWPHAERLFSDALQTARMTGSPKEVGLVLFHWGREGLRHDGAKASERLVEAVPALEQAGSKQQAQKARALLEKMGK